MGHRIRRDVVSICGNFYSEKERKALRQELERTSLVPKVCKRFNGGSFIGKKGESTLETSDRVVSREQNRVFRLYLEIGRDSAIVVLETTPLLPSEGEKGSKVAMPYLKFSIGILTISGFQRSTSIPLPILAKGLGVTFANLIDRIEKFVLVNQSKLNIQTVPKPSELGTKIIRVVPASQLKNCYPRYHHSK